jgi:DNA-binding IclR family transcriptional regulator
MGVRSARRVLDLIEWLAAQEKPMGLAETSQSLKLPKSSALELLKTLVDGRFAEREADGRYRLLRLPGEHSAGHFHWGTLKRIAEPAIVEAVEEVQESGFLAVLTPELRLRYIVKILPPEREIRYDRNMASDRIAHHVTSGVAILSGLKEEELRDYLRRASAFAKELKTDPGRKKLFDGIAKVRRLGYTSNLVGPIEGAGGAAAPIFDRTGWAVGAINIAGPTARVKASLSAIERATLETAQRVTRELAERIYLPLKSRGC